MSQRKRKPGRGGSATAGRVSVPSAPTSAGEGGVSTPQVSGAPLELPEVPAAARARAASRPPHPEPEQHWIERYSSRAEIRNAEARARLVPLARDEHPWPLKVAIALALVFSLGTLVLMVAGVKVNGKTPSASWIFYVLVMFACGAGMWRHWYQAVLGFMGLLGIALIILCALVVRFSNALGLIVPLVLILAGGTLFWKLVGVLARMQMPQRPTRATGNGSTSRSS